MAQEEVGGESLRDYFERENIRADVVLRIFRQLTDLTCYSKRMGIVMGHLGLASFVVVEREGHPEIRLVDLGVPRILELKEETLPPEELKPSLFSAPEVWQRRELTAEADSFSLGVIMSVILFGRAPYRDEVALLTGGAVFPEEQEWTGLERMLGTLAKSKSRHGRTREESRPQAPRDGKSAGAAQPAMSINNNTYGGSQPATRAVRDRGLHGGPH